jgi:hypothetical protein
MSHIIMSHLPLTNYPICLGHNYESKLDYYYTQPPSERANGPLSCVATIL